MRRQRYERSDVPRANPRRPIYAIIALALIGFGLYYLVNTLWTRAQFDSVRGDAEFANALSAAVVPEIPEGYTRTEDEYENTLILVIDDMASESPRLTDVKVLSINHTTSTAALLTYPLDMRVSTADGPTTLTELFLSARSVGTVAPMQVACGMPIQHLVLTDVAHWDELVALDGVETKDLPSKHADLLMSLRSDYSSQEMLGVNDALQAIGFPNIRLIDLRPGTEWIDDEEVAWMTVNGTDVATSLGFLEAPEPEEEAAEEAETESEG